MLTFNEATQRACAEIPIEEDDVSEDPEDFPVILTSDDPDISSDRPRANVTITDNDNVTFGFEREQYSAREDQGMVEVCSRVIEGSLEREVSIILRTNSISAQSPDDYQETSETLTFSESVQVQCVNVSLADDDVLEGVEEFEGVLDAGDEERINLSPERTLVMITDDDGNY